MASALRILRPLGYRFFSNFILKIKPLSISASYSACHTAINNFKKAQGSSLLCDHFNRPSEVIQQVRCMSIDKKLTQDEVSDKVMDVCKAFDRIQEADKVSLDSHFNKDLGLDSLDHVELIMNMEDEFNIEIPDGDAEKLLRPKDIVEYIMRKQEVMATT